MESLYVVEFDVRPAAASELAAADVRDRVVGHISDWLSFERTPVLDPNLLDSDGTATLVAERDDRSDNRVSWVVEGSEQASALVLTVRTDIRKSARSDFICIATVFTENDRLAVRLELGRETLDGVIAPAGLDFFRRPFVLVKLFRDRDLDCWSGPTKIDGRFRWINPKDTGDLWEAVSIDRRLLPILLVDARGEAGEQLALRAASELAGLASVYAVDDKSQQLLAERLDSIDAAVPSGGVRLVWPDLSLRHPVFSADQARFAPQRIFRMLSSISVTVRGVNQLRRTAAAAQRTARREQIATQLAQARSEGDLPAEVKAQAQAIEGLREEIDVYVTWIEQLEKERDEYKEKASKAEYWKQEAERTRRSTGVREAAWGDAPDLAQSNLEELAKFLENQSGGAILFTPSAKQSWKQDQYLHVSNMQVALVSLAQAAMEYRRLECQLGTNPDDWFKQEWGLNLASTDQTMSKKRLDQFEFKGKSYSRLPHLKLGDSTAPNEVGRVYFAMDSEGERFIVDHVGLKLHGL